MHASDQGAAHG